MNLAELRERLNASADLEVTPAQLQKWLEPEWEQWVKAHHEAIVKDAAHRILKERLG